VNRGQRTPFRDGNRGDEVPTFEPPTTTRDRRTTHERTLLCPRDGARKSIADCLAFEEHGCAALLPSWGCRALGVFGRERTRESDEQYRLAIDSGSRVV